MVDNSSCVYKCSSGGVLSMCSLPNKGYCDLDVACGRFVSNAGVKKDFRGSLGKSFF